MSEGAGHSSGSVDSDLVKVTLGLAALVLVAAFAIPKFFSPKISWNDTSAHAALRNLASVQAQVQASARIDVDGDGIGEYGTFGELTGADGLRASADASHRKETLRPPILSPSLAAVGEDGIVTRSGYCFRMVLPGDGGVPVREGKAGHWTGGPARSG